MQRKNPGFEDVTKKFRKRGILLDLRFSPGSRERQALLALHTDLFWRGSSRQNARPAEIAGTMSPKRIQVAVKRAEKTGEPCRG
jgi:hypothetical protein